MSKLEEIRAEAIELENVVVLLKEEIDKYEKDIKESGREMGYNDYRYLADAYGILHEKTARLKYIRKFIY